MRLTHSLRHLRQYLTAHRAPARPRQPVRNRLEIEGLETRLAPSCTGVPSPPHLTFNCTAADDDIKVQSMSPASLAMRINDVTTNWNVSLIGFITINAGDGNDAIKVLETAAGKTLTINAGNHNDHVDLGLLALGTWANLSDLQGPVIANAGAGLDSISFQDETNTAGNYYVTSTSVSRSGSPTFVHNGFNDGITLHGNDGGNSSMYTVANTPVFRMSLITGIGASTVNVQGTTGPLTIHGMDGIDTVKVGSEGKVQDIQGSVTVNSWLGQIELTIDDNYGTQPRTGTLTATGLTGFAPAPITWMESKLRSLQIKGSHHDTTVHVTDTPNNLRFLGTTLATGNGTDTVHVRGTTGELTVQSMGGPTAVNVGDNGSVQALHGPVTVTGYANSINLTVNAAATSPKNATLAFNHLSGLTPATVYWGPNDLRSLTVSGGSGGSGSGNTFTVINTPTALLGGVTLNTGIGLDTVNVQATSAVLTINGQSGLDKVTLGSAGSAQSITRNVSVTNAASRTALTVNDSASAAAETAMLTPHPPLRSVRGTNHGSQLGADPAAVADHPRRQRRRHVHP